MQRDFWCRFLHWGYLLQSCFVSLSRSRNYFEKICLAESGKYPNALHEGHFKPEKVVWNVKKRYKKSLGEFLQEGKCEGKPVPSFDGKPRSGEYYVYALVKSRKGKQELIKVELIYLLGH